MKTFELEDGSSVSIEQGVSYGGVDVTLTNVLAHNGDTLEKPRHMTLNLDNCNAHDMVIAILELIDVKDTRGSF